MNKYLKFCKKCMDKKIELSKNYYVLDSDDDNAKYKNKDSIDVSIVSPTQAAVEQAKRMRGPTVNLSSDYLYYIFCLEKHYITS